MQHVQTLGPWNDLEDSGLSRNKCHMSTRQLCETELWEDATLHALNALAQSPSTTEACAERITAS
jgi:hypothetical protein